MPQTVYLDDLNKTRMPGGAVVCYPDPGDAAAAFELSGSGFGVLVLRAEAAATEADARAGRWAPLPLARPETGEAFPGGALTLRTAEVMTARFTAALPAPTPYAVRLAVAQVLVIGGGRLACEARTS